MAMHNPPHPGEFISAVYLEPNGLSGRELATKLGAEKKVDPGLMEATHRKGHEALDVARLRQYVDNPDRHEQLQAVMKLFEAGLGPAPLLDQLETESRRDRRRLLLLRRNYECTTRHQLSQTTKLRPGTEV